MKLFFYLPLLFILGMFFSCQAPAKETLDLSETQNLIKSSYENDILDQYFHLKDALASDDMKKVREVAKYFKNLSDNLYLSTDLKKSVSNEAIQSLRKLGTISQEIIDAENIQNQRIAFFKLSKYFSEALRNGEIINPNPESKIYIQFCPMAFKNSGAIWMSSDYDIVNPYFGEVMLTCGVVRDSI